MNDTILQALREDANNLIRAAQANNAVVAITLEPQEPLAMGNYAMVADVRPARQRAAPGFDLDAMCREAMTRLSAEISADANAHKLALFDSYFESRMAARFAYHEAEFYRLYELANWHTQRNEFDAAWTLMCEGDKHYAVIVDMQQLRSSWLAKPNRDGSVGGFW